MNVTRKLFFCVRLTLEPGLSSHMIPIKPLSFNCRIGLFGLVRLFEPKLMNFKIGSNLIGLISIVHESLTLTLEPGSGFEPPNRDSPTDRTTTRSTRPARTRPGRRGCSPPPRKADPPDRNTTRERRPRCGRKSSPRT